MFIKNNDSFLNKREKKAIIYNSVNGTQIRLTRADFSSEGEFLKWKDWSDMDYHDIERSGRDFYDYGISLDERLDFIGAVPSIEDELFTMPDEAEYIQRRSECRAELLMQVKSIMTEKQYHRLWMLHAENKSVKAIAAAEGVSHQNIFKSNAAAMKKIRKLCAKQGAK